MIRVPLRLTAVLSVTAAITNVRLSHHGYTLIPASCLFASRSALRSFSGDPAVQSSELTRLPTILDGCDYKHWLVVTEAPRGYPLRDEIVRGYIRTLALVLGSEEEAKKSIYSVSTKYYYAFGCKIAEILAHQVKSLPNVKWVLPDSYLCHGRNGYGEKCQYFLPIFDSRKQQHHAGVILIQNLTADKELPPIFLSYGATITVNFGTFAREPFVNGEVVPYDEKYHTDWLRDQSDDKCRNKTISKKARRKRKKLFSKDQGV